MEIIKENINKGISFLKEPAKLFDSIKKEKLDVSFKYVAILAGIFAVLNAIVSTVVTGIATAFLMAPVVFVSGLIVGYVGIIIGVFISGIWLHICSYLLGGKANMEQTIKVVMYAGTPTYLIGWIPIISLIAGIWSIVLAGMGIMKIHGFTGGKAIAVLAIAILIPLIIGGIVFASIVMPMMYSLGAIDPSLMMY